MSHARVYKPCKSAHQSGRAPRAWVLRFDPTSSLQKNHITGWIPSEDMLQEVSLFFNTSEEALNFAKSKGFSCTLQEPTPQKNFPKSYGDHFRFDRKRF